MHTGGTAAVLERTESGEELTIIHEFPDISSWQSGNVAGRLTMRIVEKKGRQFIDIREYIMQPGGSGYTKRGIRLSVFAAEKLYNLLPQGVAAILGKGEPNCDSNSATLMAARVAGSGTH